jgi:hypothetical protein
MAVTMAIPFVMFIGLVPAILQSPSARTYLQTNGFYFSLSMFVGFFTAWDLLILYLSRRWLTRQARERLTNPIVHTRKTSSFFVFSKTKMDSNPPFNIRNATKAG